MKQTQITERLAGLGGAKWHIHLRAKEMAEQGHDIIQLTIGEPDVPTPTELIDAATRAMHDGRLTYSNGRGEIGLRTALAQRYSQRTNTTITPDQVMCFPGTQTSLFAVLMAVSETGDDVLVGDPMYATYEGVIRATGAAVVPVPLRPEHGFRIAAADIADRITPNSTAILLNTPHNPTGAILTLDDLRDIGALAIKHDLWIICDEVYEDMVFAGRQFKSPLALPELADRVIIVSSISKSHAAPGFRSGWCIGPEAFTNRLLSLSETMLFGNQPFIADTTEVAIRNGSPVAQDMCARFAARADILATRLTQSSDLRVHKPDAGMFALVDISATGMTGDDYATHLLDHAGVAVMPGASFGASLENWIRVALTVPDAEFDQACERIIAHAAKLTGSAT